MKDPRYPDRPDSPDFWALSEALLHNDSIEQAEDIGAEYERRVSEVIDLDVLHYVVVQRLMRVKERDHHRHNDDKAEAWFSAAWVDGFMAAVEYMKRRNIVRDGGHR
jgi:hypothetical protein